MLHLQFSLSKSTKDETPLKETYENSPERSKIGGIFFFLISEGKCHQIAIL